ncbi:ABC transporter permease [Desulfovibrio sulfodismutans]|uniref:ABC transporter permease n=1 Tax=Desulfolutivibrio sulfodismutans TaxID=63561 RepID=A0A7K3NGY6_9BACT|nr:ABC transporter permease [Desulfolutivibrio sulfodismutans]NDY55464.1 ABC transporter permease [Desulfolutivibrio sulfodismutans]QLA12853.1 ABC transporter permease subunit [Desulfolutivibrio sulfodismutans DSM 3696]
MMRLAGRLLPLFLLAAWEALCRTGVIDSRFVPAPSAILACLAAPGTAGDMLGQMGLTLRRTLLGFALGGAAGLCLGLACGALRRLDETLSPLIELLRPVPSVAVIPVAILFLGLGDALNVAVTAFACSWPVFVAGRDAVRAVEPLRLDTARLCGLTRGRRFLAVILPASLPGAVTGLRTALGIAVAVAVGSEMAASSDGLGHLAMAASFSRQQALAFAAVLAMGLVGGACAFGFSSLLRLAGRFWPGLFRVQTRLGEKP